MQDLREKLLSLYSDAPQLREKVHVALEKMAQEIGELEKLGHRLVLGFAEPEPILVFPKVLYQTGLPPVVVENSTEEAKLLGEGWAEHASANTSSSSNSNSNSVAAGTGAGTGGGN